jgi:RNA polymerase sigma-70 factor (ECF subfamily)
MLWEVIRVTSRRILALDKLSMKMAQQQAALARARSGDSEALGQLLESFRPYVRFIIHALRGGRLQSRLDDEDLIQEALLQAHQGFTDFRGGTTAELTAWLRQIVIRRIGRLLRHHLDTEKRDASREEEADLLGGVADAGTSPSEQAIRHEQAAQIAQAMERLPQDMQQVLLGRHMECLSFAILAKRMGRSEGALRVLYSRALERLRQDCRE